MRADRPVKGTDMVRKPTWPALLLGLIPFVGMCFTVPLWDRIHPFVAGLPFNLFWLMLWIVLTPLCLWGAYRFEKRADLQHANARQGGAR
jgi:4-amino-4-deoxy-L-arabinose transferase-like glycosyltransferase